MGLDSRYQDPDAVCLLYGAAADVADPLAELLARTLYGRSSALIDIDLAGMTEDQSISTLLGSAPGLVGSERALPLHALRRAPWQVLLLRGIDRCAASVRDTIAQGLERGAFTDAMGRALPLGAAVVVMTAPAIDAAELLEPLLGHQLVASATLIAGTAGTVADAGRDEWLRRDVLDPLAGRFDRQGYEVTFDSSFVDWLTTNLPKAAGSAATFIDTDVTPALAASLPAERARLIATVEDGKPTFKHATDP